MKLLSPVYIALIFAVSNPVQADIFEPFSTSNLNPFVQVYGLPKTRSAKLATDGEIHWRLQVDLVNNFTADTERSEQISIDGETHKVTLSLQYGITDRLELGLEIPYTRHTGGSLDGFIEDWHDFWGLPNGGRENMPEDLLNYHHQINGVSTNRLSNSKSAIGDVQLYAGYQLNDSDTHTWTVRGGVKLPTGDPDDLSGSDSADLFTSLHLSHAVLFNNPNLYFHGNAGILALGNGKVIEQQLQDWVFFGSGALAWHVWEKVSLKAQVDFHSAFYDSDLTELGNFSAQLVFGGTVKLGERLLLDLSISEDIVTDTAPDVVFQIGLHTTF